MKKEEAIHAMINGERVTHHYFTNYEWMTIRDGVIELEDGVTCPQHIFWQYRQGEGWNDGYSIFN